jgi:ribose/xylose/arabinose/galactoside ABC-type transport system permease subunit
MNEPLSPAARPAVPGPAAPAWARLRRFFARTEWGLLVAIVAAVVLTALLDSQHNYWRNPGQSAINILRQTAFLGIFALGAAIVIIAGGIDLSSGSVIAFSGSLCAIFLVLLAPEQVKESRNVGAGVIALAVLGTLLVGLLIGSFHAWLITVVDLPPFVATLATLVGLRSLGRVLVEEVTRSVWKSPKTQIDIADSQFRALTSQVWIPVGLFVLLAVLAWVLMSRTVVGRHLHALGGNEQAARLSGIQTDRLKWLAYCLSAVLASVAGILYVSDTTTANPQNLGRGYELNAIAAAVVGGCSLSGGVGTILGTVLGVLFLRTVIDGVAKIIKSNAEVYEGLIVGGVVVVAVAFTQLRLAARQGKRFFGGALGLVTIVNLALLVGVLAVLFSQESALGSGTVGGIAALVALVVLVLARVLEGRRHARRLTALSADKASKQP